jgi:hypothetical protein
MGWITIDYYLVVTSDSGQQQFDDPDRTPDRSRSCGRQGRASTSKPAPTRGESEQCGLRMAANASPWRGGRSTSTSELVPPRSA